MHTHFMPTLVVSVFLLPHAVAFADNIPRTTTLDLAADIWIPAPTEAPASFNQEFFKRDKADNTCGFVSASSESSITCPNSNAICATNTYLGVHGCCDASALSLCTLATSCISATAMSTECTNLVCSSDEAIAKCTANGMGQCCEWHFVYGTTTTMIQHGCATSSFTSTAYRSWVTISSSTTKMMILTVTTPPATSPSDTLPIESPIKPSIGGVIGGTIGACLFISIIAFAIFLVYRRRKMQRENAPSTLTHHTPHIAGLNNTPLASPLAYNKYNQKIWQQHHAMDQMQCRTILGSDMEWWKWTVSKSPCKILRGRVLFMK